MSAHGAYAQGGPRRVALVGRPNVGKSSLLNRLAGSERVVVDNVAGTTRDPVDELIELGGKTWRFVDTAGIRRRVHQTRGADFYASLRTQTRPREGGGRRRAHRRGGGRSPSRTSASSSRPSTPAAPSSSPTTSGTPLDEERRYYLEREIERELVQVPWAPRVNISARTGRHMDRLVPAIETALESWDTRVPTGRLNAFLGEIVASHPHPVRGGKQPRILFAHPGLDPAAALRPLRIRVHRGGLPPLPRASAARAVRLRGHADRGVGPGAGETAPLTRRAPLRRPRPRGSRPSGIRVRSLCHERPAVRGDDHPRRRRGGRSARGRADPAPRRRAVDQPDAAALRAAGLVEATLGTPPRTDARLAAAAEGEEPHAAVTRFADAVWDISDLTRGETSVVITHADILAAAVASRCRNVPADLTSSEPLDAGETAEIDVDSDGWVCIRWGRHALAK